MVSFKIYHGSTVNWIPGGLDGGIGGKRGIKENAVMFVLSSCKNGDVIT